MPGMAFKLKAEKKCTFLHFSEDCEEIRYMAGHHDYTVRPSTAMMNSQGVLNSPAAVSSVHKKNSFLAPHLSRFGRRSTALNSMNNMEVVVVGSNDKRPESDLSKKKIAETNIKSIKSDDEDSDDGKLKKNWWKNIFCRDLQELFRNFLFVIFFIFKQTKIQIIPQEKISNSFNQFI